MAGSGGSIALVTVVVTVETHRGGESEDSGETDEPHSMKGKLS